MRVLLENGDRYLVETVDGDILVDLAQERLTLIEPPITRESLTRFDPSWQEPPDGTLPPEVALALARADVE